MFTFKNIIEIPIVLFEEDEKLDLLKKWKIILNCYLLLWMLNVGKDSKYH